MGWTCGYAISSARDVAKFYFDLLGPEPKILSKEAVKTMQEFKEMDMGWSAGVLEYGAGLMIMNMSPVRLHGPLPSLDNPATFIGHGGETYGFYSQQGFYPNLNVSISLMMNGDFDNGALNNLLCQIDQVVMAY